MRKRRLRVVVCGTTFGRFYLNGIKRISDDYELVGILARGSDNSKQCAKEYGVPIYTSVDEINKEDVDVACVVIRSSIVGGYGSKIAMDFLKKGINVVQEQPIHQQDVIEGFKTSKKNNCQFIINSFYPYIDTVSEFINTAEKLIKKTKAVYIDAACSIQVLFPLIDMLGRIAGGFMPWKLENEKIIKSGIFTICTGKIKNIPFIIKIQNKLNTEDPDNYFHLLHRITLGCESGSLVLTEVNSHVLWIPRIFISKNQLGVLDMYEKSRFLNLPVSELVKSPGEVTYKEVYEEVWPDAIKNMLIKYKDVLSEGKRDNNHVQHYLSVCKIWNEIGQAIGNNESLGSEQIIPLSIKDLN